MLALSSVLLAAQTSLSASVPFAADPDELYRIFQSVCVSSPDIATARSLARSQPGASPVERPDQPPTHRVYATPQLAIGVLGNPSATCYVSGVVNTDADVERVAALLAEMRGRPLRMRSQRQGELRYAGWGPQHQPYRFEAKRLEGGHLQVLISLRNKKAD